MEGIRAPASLHPSFCLRLALAVAVVAVALSAAHVGDTFARPRPALAREAAAAVAVVGRSIVVDPSGAGDFTSLQAAVDSVPDGNTGWVRILVGRGTYTEKVEVPESKPFIAMEGVGGARQTVVQWGDFVGSANNTSPTAGGGGPVGQTARTPTFTVLADNFVARGITFKNSYADVAGRPQTQAVAAMIGGDKAAFYDCGFVGFQDTLCDDRGRHYFPGCYIEGFVDFIFGGGQSIYDECEIRVAESAKPYGYITAQGRRLPGSSSGYVFKRCNVTGGGRAYLGRAWGTYPFVLFYRSFMSGAVIPAGWDAYTRVGQEDVISFAEENCYGPGSDVGGRVQWEKRLTEAEIQSYISMSFIDEEGWLGRQP